MINILIAEDEPVSCRILSSLLDKWGFGVITADNGIDALEYLEKDRSIRIALIDWNMPQLTGPDVCKKIKELYPENPPYLIMLTAKTEKTSIILGLESGADDYITKPYDSGELRARIRVGERMTELQTRLIDTGKKLEYEASHDSLTAVYNRKTVMELLDKEHSRAERQNTAFSIALIDIDDFKMINDKYGHQTGDEILSGLVSLINDTLRNYDIVGRYGGEEFLIVLPETDAGTGFQVLERMAESIRKNPVKTRSGNLIITVSAGLCGYSPGINADKMISIADTAMYEAKRLGKDRVILSKDGISYSPVSDF